MVFDAVGTLIEPDPSVADVYVASAARQGVTLARAEVRERFRRHFRNDEVDEAKGPMVTDEALEYRRWRRIVGSVLPEVADPGRAFEELWHHFARPDAWRCFPDVGPAVRALTGAGLPLRIASNFDRRLRAVVAGLPEIAALSDSLVISSEVSYRKPHPAFYRAVCASLGLPPSVSFASVTTWRTMWPGRSGPVCMGSCSTGGRRRPTNSPESSISRRS